MRKSFLNGANALLAILGLLAMTGVKSLAQAQQPYAFVHDGQVIKLCCEDCMAEFQEGAG